MKTGLPTLFPHPIANGDRPLPKGRGDDGLPLLYRTPDSWAGIPLSNLRALLSDHAYLERKATSNALELLNRWPEPNQPANWTKIISGIARDEASHLNLVVKIMRRRGWDLERLHRGKYPGDLRALVRLGKGPKEVADRLLVSALIEARSCERFGILARLCKDDELRKLYASLYTSEFGHYHVYVQLAEEILSKEETKGRFQQMLKDEARIIAAQPKGPGLHSGAEMD